MNSLVYSDTHDSRPICNDLNLTSGRKVEEKQFFNYRVRDHLYAYTSGIRAGGFRETYRDRALGSTAHADVAMCVRRGRCSI